MTLLRMLAVLACAHLALWAEPLPAGPGRITVEAGVPIEVFTYKPATYRDGPLILVFHGVNRNAEDYRDFAIALAERCDAIVATPLFDRGRFPTEAYQQGGIMKDKVVQPRERWTWELLPKLIAGLRAREEKPDWPYYFIGHSAGGQFLVRMAALAGGMGAQRVVAANPGSHLFPTRAAPYGYGFGGLPEELSGDEAIRAYLAAPLTIYLGTGDINPDDRNLDRSEHAMRQGRFRHERGRACFAAARKLADERGWVFGWRLVEAPDIGHDAARMFAAPEARDALFGTDTAHVE